MDLPYSLKWLRLRSSNKRQEIEDSNGKKKMRKKMEWSSRFFVISSLKSVIVMSLLFAFNVWEAKETWNNAEVTCTRVVRAGCLSRFGTMVPVQHNDQKWNASNRTNQMIRPNVTRPCPSNFRTSLNQYMSASQKEKKGKSAETWLAGACYSSDVTSHVS